MKQYELSVLFRPETEAAIDTATAKVKKIVEDNGGKIIKEDVDGKKRMAYEIKGEEYAFYVYYDVELPPMGPAKVQSVLNITDGILRTMVVSCDERKARYLEKQAARAKKEEKKEEE